MAVCAWPLSGGSKSGGSAVALPLPVLSARPLFFARHSGEGRNPAPCLFLQCRAFDSPCGRAGYFWHCPKVTKRLGTGRGGPIRIVRIGLPCASRVRRGRLRARPCARSRRARIVRAPLRAISAAPCDARHRERRRFVHEPVHPCTAPIRSFAPGQTCRKNKQCERLLLRQDAAQTGPPVARRVGAGKAQRVARRMRASSLHAHGRAFSEPRSLLANLEGRMPERRVTWGVFLSVTFLCTSKER